MLEAFWDPPIISCGLELWWKDGKVSEEAGSAFRWRKDEGALSEALWGLSDVKQVICSITVSMGCVYVRVCLCIVCVHGCVISCQVRWQASRCVCMCVSKIVKEKVSIWDWLCRGVCVCVRVRTWWWERLEWISGSRWVSSTNYCTLHICCHPTERRVCSGTMPTHTHTPTNTHTPYWASLRQKQKLHKLFKASPFTCHSH